MLLSLRSDHKDHLNLLISQPSQIIVDFCKLALDFLINGPNTKLYTTAAQKLNVEHKIVENCIHGLVNLLLESCKHKLNDVDFRDSVLTIGFSQEQQTVLSKFYETKKEEIIDILSKITVNDYHYHDLNWRFELQVASRSLLHQVTPLIAMEFILRKDNLTDTSDERVLVQTDPNNLVHLTNELERALAESRSSHSRRMQRILNST